MKLGKISKVELRDYWQYEDRDFTPWLAKEDNIQLLGDELGLDLEVLVRSGKECRAISRRHLVRKQRY